MGRTVETGPEARQSQGILWAGDSRTVEGRQGPGLAGQEGKRQAINSLFISLFLSTFFPSRNAFELVEWRKTEKRKQTQRQEERMRRKVGTNENGQQSDAYMALRRNYGPVRKEDEKMSRWGQTGGEAEVRSHKMEEWGTDNSTGLCWKWLSYKCL